MNTAPQLVWFRQDLRIIDQPALRAAADRGPVVGLYVLDDETPGPWKLGGASRWWLHYSLRALGEELKRLGSRLILRRGRSSAVVREVALEAKAGAIHATRHYEPWWREAECEHGDFVIVHDGDVLHEPSAIRSGTGGLFKIFSPYYRALEAKGPPPLPRPAPNKLTGLDEWPASDRLEDWQLLPTSPDWAAGLSVWEPGARGAEKHLRRFAVEAASYAQRRDLPAQVGTSNLPAHLHFGEISPREVWHSLDAAGDKFRREVAWRDFSRQVILASPQMGTIEQRPLRMESRTGPAADADFEAWSKGRTGYPIVDAGMRQLSSTGWMHNRVRLITASFLVKHLLIDWRRGLQWFWDTLVDADYANNSQNWQWIAGTGHDSQPFYREMAPLIQSEKFEAQEYIRAWVPELAHLSDADIHDPHGRGCAPAGYPQPLVLHREGRERALEAFRDRLPA